MSDATTTQDSNAESNRETVPANEEAGPTVEICVDIAADPEAVWDALTTANGLQPWMGQGAVLQPVPGGTLDLPDPVGGAPRSGRVDHVGERALRFTWWPQDDPQDHSQVTITVTPAETGSTVTITETAPRASVQQQAQMGSGWQWRTAMLQLAFALACVRGT